MILTPLQKMPKNVRDLGKFIVAKGFKKLPKVQKIAQSGHTAILQQLNQLGGHRRAYAHKMCEINRQERCLLIECISICTPFVKK